jgi:hypothetical protein
MNRWLKLHRPWAWRLAAAAALAAGSARASDWGDLPIPWNTPGVTAPGTPDQTVPTPPGTDSPPPVVTPPPGTGATPPPSVDEPPPGTGNPPPDVPPGTQNAPEPASLVLGLVAAGGGLAAWRRTRRAR